MPTTDRPTVRRPRIDLLPARVPRARLNKKLLGIFGIALVAAVFIMLAMVGGTAQKLEAAKARRDKAATRAQEVDKVTNETMQLQSRLAPISDKVKFINQADECGYPYWDRFYEVNEYIAGYAQLLAFAIVADKAPGGPIGDGNPEALYNIAGPGSSADCALLVRVPGGNALARFVLNMTRCPAMTDIRFQNAGGGGLFNVNPGFVIRTTMPEIASPIPSGMSGGMAAGASTGGAPGAGGAGRGMGMMGGAPGGMPGGMPGGGPGGPGGMPGAGGPGGPGGGMMMAGTGGGMPGMGAAPGGSAGGATTQQSGLVYTVPIMQARPDLSFSDVYLVVTGKLARPIKVPQPPGIGGAAPAAGGAAGGGMMMGGMPGGAGGAMGGAMMPGAGGAGAPGPGGAAGGAGAKSEDKSGKADSSKASKASTKSDSGDE